jgi:predicted CXXCH cytochrome family protein
MPTGRLHLRSGSCAAAIFTILAIAAMVGCSVRENYKTLSFFFDGVPDPNAPVNIQRVGNSSDSSNPLAGAKMYLHKPYAEQRCTECHTPDKKQLIMLKEDLCVKCHEDKTHQYAVMHAPVAAGQCMWCHEPHESDQPRLLKTTAPDLCLQCHDLELLPSSNPAHRSDMANCLSCHLGHGGIKGSMLRADNPQVQAVPLAALPTTKPADDETARPPGGEP